VTRRIASAAAVVICFCIASCASTPEDEALSNANRNLEGTLQAQQRRIDELTSQNAELAQSNQELQARVDRVSATDEAVKEAKGEISAHVREILQRFKSDSDIEVEKTSDGYRFVLREAVLFSTGSSDLTDEGRAALQRVADALRGGKSAVSIEGHTDDVPVGKEETLKKFPRGNVELSAMRAIAVWEHLVKNGKVEEERLSVVGFGPHRPRVPNDSERNRWRNRRVEIRVAEQ
jgi:chemotaxis protein MotB